MRAMKACTSLGRVCVACQELDGLCALELKDLTIAAEVKGGTKGFIRKLLKEYKKQYEEPSSESDTEHGGKLGTARDAWGDACSWNCGVV